MSIVISERIKLLSDSLAERSRKESSFYPIDRYFLEPYLKDILEMDRNSFLLYNMQRVNPNYTVHLFLCLPELWEDITVKDVIDIVNQFTNPFSYYTIIEFTHKFIEINLIELIMDLKTTSFEVKEDIKSYVHSQYPNLIKTESDFLFFEDRVYGVQNESWMYIKQVLLLDKRLKPALTSLTELKKYIETL